MAHQAWASAGDKEQQRFRQPPRPQSPLEAVLDPMGPSGLRIFRHLLDLEPATLVCMHRLS
jgi:hypothetical protein